MLCDIGDPGAGAVVARREWWTGARNHFGFEVGSFGSGQGTDGAHAFCFGGRQLVGVCGVQSPARGGDCRAVELDAQELIFTPHLLPIPRGILSTIYVHLNREMTPLEVEVLLSRISMRASAGCGCFRRRSLPQIQFSLHTNYCDLGFCLAEDGRRLVLVSCVDNLLKGAAGQAVQNMNLMYGWKEEEGLQ